ncbi:hypothetical protein L6452_08867 [Arctium lappa]|uniref:Uncharacterized protein n=1 Tax=Arctium lappa TaxID=4217 RepID=A0ACB9DIH2_ARCLA|nr:hypothetical protein L6452_08867 [Arctium lappa]
MLLPNHPLPLLSNPPLENPQRPTGKHPRLPENAWRPPHHRLPPPLVTLPAHFSNPIHHQHLKMRIVFPYGKKRVPQPHQSQLPLRTFDFMAPFALNGAISSTQNGLLHPSLVGFCGSDICVGCEDIRAVVHKRE